MGVLFDRGRGGGRGAWVCGEPVEALTVTFIAFFASAECVPVVIHLASDLPPAARLDIAVAVLLHPRVVQRRPLLDQPDEPLDVEHSRGD